MIELNGFSNYRLKIESNEVYSIKDGELVLVVVCKDSSVKSWNLYKNGVRVRKSIWNLYSENREKIERYCREKLGLA